MVGIGPGFSDSDEKLSNDGLFVGNPHKAFTPHIALIGTDKGGKGTTWRHSLFALGQLGYDVMGITYPSYNTIGGFGAEVFLSYKEIFEHAPSLGISTDGWSKEKYMQFTTYVMDRSRSISDITNHVEKGGVALTKRTAKQTHAAYQKAFNGIPHETTFKAEPFYPDASIIMNMLPREATLQDFSDKGNSVLDDYESRDQSPVALAQRNFTEQPALGNAHYGFFFGGEAPERLDTILQQLLPILDKHNVTRSPHPREIKINGLEEPAYDLRTKEGIEHFINDFDGAKLLEMFFGQKYSVAQSYEEVFTTDNPVMYPYAKKIKPEIMDVIEKYRT